MDFGVFGDFEKPSSSLDQPTGRFLKITKNIKIHFVYFEICVTHCGVCVFRIHSVEKENITRKLFHGISWLWHFWQQCHECGSSAMEVAATDMITVVLSFYCPCCHFHGSAATFMVLLRCLYFGHIYSHHPDNVFFLPYKLCLVNSRHAIIYFFLP